MIGGQNIDHPVPQGRDQCLAIRLRPKRGFYFVMGVILADGGIGEQQMMRENLHRDRYAFIFITLDGLHTAGGADAPDVDAAATTLGEADVPGQPNFLRARMQSR